MNNFKQALQAQKNTWLKSTVLWSDFSDDFEIGMRKHREAIEFDFLTDNDQCDFFTFDNEDHIALSLELRSDCLFDTLQALDLL